MSKEKILLIVQAMIVYLLAFVAGLICFGALNLVFDIDVMRASASAAFGASAWTVVSALIIGWAQRKNE